MIPTITTFGWVPAFARGFVRDMRPRWAFEEVGQKYAVELITDAKCPEHRRFQPFGQVPTYRDDDVAIFESGAIVLHIAERAGKLIPADPAPRMRALQWLAAALNSVEPFVMALAVNDIFEADREWSTARHVKVVDDLKTRLADLESALGNNVWLDGDEFTVGDLMMISVLGGLRRTPELTGFPRLAAYVARGEDRPAHIKAMADHLAIFDTPVPSEGCPVNGKGKETMGYFQGFVIPVRIANKQAYLDMAKKAAPIFAEHGALRTVECWGDDVMAGKITDFKKAVQANDDETVVLSWVWWPDKATCDAAAGKIMADDRMKPDGPLPFDGQRLIYAGFEANFDTGGDGRFGYIDAMVASVPDGDRQAFLDHAAKMARLFQEKGAQRLVDGWGTDVPAGKVTDFRRAVQAKDGESVIFGWIEWPDKPTRDAGMGALMDDPRMREVPPAWNGQLAIFGGFTPILDTSHA